MLESGAPACGAGVSYMDRMVNGDTGTSSKDIHVGRSSSEDLELAPAARSRSSLMKGGRTLRPRSAPK